MKHNSREFEKVACTLNTKKGIIYIVNRVYNKKKLQIKGTTVAFVALMKHFEANFSPVLTSAQHWALANTPIC